MKRAATTACLLLCAFSLAVAAPDAPFARRTWRDAAAFISRESALWRGAELDPVTGGVSTPAADRIRAARERDGLILDFLSRHRCAARLGRKSAADSTTGGWTDAASFVAALRADHTVAACFAEEVVADARRERRDGAAHDAVPWATASGRERGFIVVRGNPTFTAATTNADNVVVESPRNVGADNHSTTAAPWTWPPDWTLPPTPAPAPGSDCEYPCKLQNGCECDHHKPTFDWNDFQFYGTCSRCADGWGGWDCGNIVTQCLNGGNFTRGVGCQCPTGWTGPECGQIACVHTEHDRPINQSSQICPACAPGYSGVACDVCDESIRCPNGRMCNDTLIGAGTKLNMRCELDDPKLVVALANGRQGCRGLVKMECDKPTTWANTSGYDGVCHVTLWRVEPDAAFQDPFFFCTMSECAMQLTQTYSAPGYSKVPASAEPVRLAARIVLYVCCFVLAVMGLSPFAVIRRFRSRAFIPVSCVLVAVLLFYIFFSTFYGHEQTTPPTLRTVVEYHCKATTCNCAPAPANPLFYPSCNTSAAAPFLRHAETNGIVQCDIETGDCTFKQDQIPITFPIKCSASTCDPPAGDLPIAKASGLLSNAAGFAAVGAVGFFFAAITFSHFIWSMRRSRQMAAVFRAKYGSGGDDSGLRGSQANPADRTGLNLADPLVREPSAVNIRESATVLDINVRSYKVSAQTEATSPFQRKRNLEILRQQRVQQIAADIKTGDIDADDPAAAEVMQDDRLRESLTRRPSDIAAAAPGDPSSTNRSRGVSPEANHPLNPVPNLYETPQGSFASRGTTRASAASAAAAGYKQILRDVKVRARSGEAIAIIGSSGAGKTTLLDIIAQHDKTGIVDGTISLNGRVVTSENKWCYRRSIGFVAQEDALLPSLTVRQTIRHAARLKLPSAVEDEVIDRKVDDLLQTLHLTLCADSVVGGGATGSRGISGGERRRVSIAMELIANPRMLLLDEPTSGLDSVNAHVVMKTVVDMARSEKPDDAYRRFFAYRPIVVFSIHQPSTDIFRLFDKLIVLSRGRVLYSGPAQTAVAHTAAMLGMSDVVDRERHRNPAELLLELHHFATPRELQLLRDHPTPQLPPAAGVTGGDANSRQPTGGSRDRREREMSAPTTPHSPGSSFRGLNASTGSARNASSSGQQQRISPRQAASDGGSPPPDDDNLVDVLELAAEGYRYCPNVWEQFFVLCQRTSDSLMGSYYLIACHAATAMLLGIVFSLLYQNEPLTLAGTEDKAGMITGMLLIIAFSSLSCLDLFMAEKRLSASERANGFYSTVPYFVCKVLFDYVPLRIVPVAMLSAVVYFPMGLREDIGGPFLWFVAISVLFSCMVCGMCLAVGMVAPSFGVAALFSSLLILWDATFGGLMINAATIPPGFRPFKFISPFYFAFEALMINEMDGLSCTIEPLNSAGISDNEPIPIPCRQFLFYLGLNPKYFDRDVFLLAAWVVGMLIIAGVLLAVFVRHRR